MLRIPVVNKLMDLRVVKCWSGLGGFVKFCQWLFFNVDSIPVHLAPLALKTTVLLKMAAFLHTLKVMTHSTLAATRSTVNFMVEKPGASTVIVGATTLVAGGVYSTQIKSWRFQRAIESTLQAGSKPKVLPTLIPIDIQSLLFV